MVKGLTTSFLIGLLGIAGANLSIFLGLGVTFWYFVRIETKELNAFWKEQYFGWKLMFSLPCMTVVLLLYYDVLNMVFGLVTYRFATFFVSVIGIGAGASVFIHAATCLRLLTVRGWLMLPFGKKILRSDKKIKK